MSDFDKQRLLSPPDLRKLESWYSLVKKGVAHLEARSLTRIDILNLQRLEHIHRGEPDPMQDPDEGLDPEFLAEFSEDDPEAEAAWEAALPGGSGYIGPRGQQLPGEQQGD